MPGLPLENCDEGVTTSTPTTPHPNMDTHTLIFQHTIGGQNTASFSEGEWGGKA